MKLLITGAAGVLGRTVTQLLEADPDVAFRLTDVVEFDTPHEFVRADLAKWEEAEPLCQGVDQVMHIAAIHPWKPYTHEQYCDCNIKACYNLLQAAANANVDRVIYTSSIAAAGYERLPDEPLPFVESRHCNPSDSLYSITKHVGEQFCELFRRRDGLCSVWLRPGCFVPRGDMSDPRHGLAFLTGYVHFSDVAAAHVQALHSGVRDEAIFITSRVPFTPDDTDALLTDAPSVILRYYPQAAALAEKGVELPQSISHCYSIAKAERLIGYDPKHNFEQWLAEAVA